MFQARSPDCFFVYSRSFAFFVSFLNLVVRTPQIRQRRQVDTAVRSGRPQSTTTRERTEEQVVHMHFCWIKRLVWLLPITPDTSLYYFSVSNISA